MLWVFTSTAIIYYGIYRHCYITQLSFLLKLPDSHTLDLHGSIVSLPGRIPLILSLPELLRAVTVLVIPGLGISFIAYSIREETICSTNRDVDDEVKLKICGKETSNDFHFQAMLYYSRSRIMTRVFVSFIFQIMTLVLETPWN